MDDACDDRQWGLIINIGPRLLPTAFAAAAGVVGLKSPVGERVMCVSAAVGCLRSFFLLVCQLPGFVPRFPRMWKAILKWSASSFLAFCGSLFGVMCALKTGFLEPLNLPQCYALYKKNADLRTTLSTCFVLNLFIYAGSMLVVPYAIWPCVLLIFPYHFRGIIEPYSVFLWYWFWVIPMFILNQIFGFVWYQKIANHATAEARTQHATKQLGIIRMLASFSNSVSDEVFRGLTTLFFTVLFDVVKLVVERTPWCGAYLGTAFWVMSRSWVWSWYAFDYIWATEGRAINHRIGYFENHWSYFLGFGLPTTLAMAWMPFGIYEATFGFVFPVWLLLAAFAKPDKNNFRLPLFAVSKTFAEEVIRYFFKKQSLKQRE
jgi:etoposide-induced 2.4 mRNA